MTYNNFNASVYCPVGNIDSIDNLDKFDEQFKLLDNNVKIGKVYLETYRGGVFIDKDQMIKVKKYFNKKGIITSSGITTEDVSSADMGFSPFCYTSSRTREKLKEIVTLTAELFDEFILDDFYFTNCRCESCIKAKETRSWSEFRVDLMKEISENVIVGTAKKVNPNVKVIIKYPNWYEHYQDAGYNLADGPQIFDYIYTGTETRNPTYTQQHLPKYLSFFIMRYLEHVASNRNLGGWFDPYECNYNLTSYLDQGYLTLFAKAKEAMLFSLGSLTNDPSYTTFPPAIGQVFADVDKYFDKLGNPTGTACYIPFHSHGEDYLHNYIGMCGIPLDPYPNYPSEATRIFLTKSAACDKDIIEKIQKSLYQGNDVIVTSGFVEALGEAFHEFMHVSYSSRKALINRYAYSENGGVTYGGCVQSAKEIMIPQMEFFTNDVWELIGGLGEDNNFPLLLRTRYAQGRLYVLTIPDDYGDIYHYPRMIINAIREIFTDNPIVELNADSKVTLFTYDNDTFILRSFNPYIDRIKLTINKENATLLDLERNKSYTGVTKQGKTIIELTIGPGVNFVLTIK